ncbi:MAG: hypothetical protein AB1428_02495 [Bacteroidota bacterium]
MKLFLVALAVVALSGDAAAQVVPKNLRGTSDAERIGQHDANNLRTRFWNYGMVGDYPSDPINVDLRTFHSMEAPKGSGVNYSDGTTPFVLSKIRDLDGFDSYIMETGYRERQAQRSNGQQMRFEPRPGYFQADVNINLALSPAISSDPRTWPPTWPDKDASWNGAWNGYFGKRPAADQESFTVMDDDYYDAWTRYFPDTRDITRRGLGMRVEVRGFQWSNPQSSNVIFWHYDITNEGTVSYPENGQSENIIFGLYMDSGVGGSSISCDGIAESDDDNAFWDRSYAGLNLVYTWDVYGHGAGIGTNCYPSGYLGYAYLETPGKPYNGVDDDDDGITDEVRNGGPGTLIQGQTTIRDYVATHYNLAKFETFYGPLDDRPAFKAARWWTGDEDLGWTAEYDDVGADGLPNTGDAGEADGIPTAGETHFDQTDPNESDQIGLTGFKMNRIRVGAGNPSTEVDNIIFFTDAARWPQRLYEKFTSPDPPSRFDNAVAANYNIGFVFASGPFTLKAGDKQRFSLALAFGSDLQELKRTISVVQAIYNANYQFSVPPPMPTVKGEAGDGYIQLTWDDVAERATNPIIGTNVFEGYRVYRSTDPDFLDPKVILTARGTTTIGNGKPIAQFDLKDNKSGFTEVTVEGIAYYLGSETGLAHSFRDTTVKNGQLYYYAVCSYDYGPTLARGTTNFTYYPSESPITVTGTLRGGFVLPQNVVAVRPNPKVLGYSPAGVSTVTRLSGTGTGTVGVKVIRSSEVPHNHVLTITFENDPDRVHARSYTLKDSTTGEVIFSSGDIFDGSLNGQVGAGLLPIVYTPDVISIDSSSGFLPGSATNATLEAIYRDESQGGMPIILRRIGFPDDISVIFSDVPIDTSVDFFPYPAAPVKFTVIAHSPTGDVKLPFLFFDLDGDSTLSHLAANREAILVLTGSASTSIMTRITWTIQMKGDNASTINPTRGDVYALKLQRPFASGDTFMFTTQGEVVASETAKKLFEGSPYVVPNPYVGAASFEPDPFGVFGRGDRRMEFRGLPQSCTIRIYTVRGDLVQTLVHDGSTNGFVAWNLRSKDNLDVAPGLYIYHVDAGTTGTSIGKFAIIK